MLIAIRLEKAKSHAEQKSWVCLHSCLSTAAFPEAQLHSVDSLLLFGATYGVMIGGPCLLLPQSLHAACQAAHYAHQPCMLLDASLSCQTMIANKLPLLLQELQKWCCTLLGASC